MLQLLSVEGPSVSMETFYIGYVKGVTSYSVSAVLEGSSFLPVTASVAISQRKAHYPGHCEEWCGGLPGGSPAPVNQLRGMQRPVSSGKHLVLCL